MTEVMDDRPQSVEWLVQEGDPANRRVHLVHEDDGSPVDATGWVWRAWIGTIPPTPFDCIPEDDGVTLYLRGSGSMGLPGRYWPFDVTARDPAAGEGFTILRGRLAASRRVTDPP